MINNKFHKNFLILFFLSILLGCSKPDAEEFIDKALKAEHRTPAYVERDKYRNPKETLLFFGLNPQQSVVEITPGYGWYAEILAPLIRNKGQYYYTSLELHEKINPYFVKVEKAFKEKMQTLRTGLKRNRTALEPPGTGTAFIRTVAILNYVYPSKYIGKSTAGSLCYRSV